MSLDPLRAHYLKKSLVSLQLQRELQDIDNVAFLGPPFHPPNSSARTRDLPFLNYIFRHFVLSFPFMAAAPNDFYSHKLQPFLDSLFARNLFDDPDALDPTPHKLVSKLERNLAMFLASAIKLVEPEDVLRLSQADLQSLERAVNKRIAKRTPHVTLFRVNIVSVRTVTDRGRVRSRMHEVCPPFLIPHNIRIPPQEFIIRTTLSHDRQVCVSRRYGDFRTLADEVCSSIPLSILSLTRPSSAKPTPTLSYHPHPPRTARQSMSLQIPRQTPHSRILPSLAAFMSHNRMMVIHHPVSPEKRTASLCVPISTPCSQPLPSPLPPSSVLFS